MADRRNGRFQAVGDAVVVGVEAVVFAGALIEEIEALREDLGK